MSVRGTSKRNNWWIFWVIVVIGVAPWVVARYLVSHPGVAGSPANHGRLVQPPFRVDYDLFHPVPGARKPLREIRGRWVMVHLIMPSDAALCHRLLENTRRLHPLFSKDIPRVRRLAVWEDGQASESAWLRALLEDPDLYMATVPRSFLQRLEATVSRRPLRCGQLALLDPLGNLMMWYDAGFDPFGLYRDLKRLLRASHIG